MKLRFPSNTKQPLHKDPLWQQLRRHLVYLPKRQISQVLQAFMVAKTAHEDQDRRSGEPYISHPVNVCVLLAQQKLDVASLQAGLLHDVIEDTAVSKQDLTEEFSLDVAEIVDGVSKLKSLKDLPAEQQQAENFQKMAFAMSQDIRVIIIKLADRLHNMRTLHHLPEHKQRKIALETQAIFAPIADRLSMEKVRIELEDLSFKVLYPLRYRMIEKALLKARRTHSDYVAELIKFFTETLKKSGFKVQVEGRRKHIAGIYKKMSRGRADSLDPLQESDQLPSRTSFKEMMDVHGFRIITDSVDNCYRILGQVHQRFRPFPGRFKDYIAVPKSNGYQSLHTSIFDPRRYPIEVQIRTQEMHVNSQLGIASHWSYKSHQAHTANHASSWLNNLTGLHATSNSPIEFINYVKTDLYPNEVLVFSPNGRVFALPSGATAIDFAYAVHTDVGNTAISCEIDKIPTTLSAKLVSGQWVKIITNPNAKPSIHWRRFAVTAKALSSIGYHLRRLEHSDASRLGRRLLNDALARYDVHFDSLDDRDLQKFLTLRGFTSPEHLLESIGKGKAYPAGVASSLATMSDHDENTPIAPVSIGEDDTSLIQIQSCCYPIKGDEITAVFTGGQGLVIHRRKCKLLRKSLNKPDTYSPAVWSHRYNTANTVQVRVDIPNHKNLIAHIVNTVTATNSSILKIETNKQDLHVHSVILDLQIADRVHLAKVIRKLYRTQSVIAVRRL